MKLLRNGLIVAALAFAAALTVADAAIPGTPPATAIVAHGVHPPSLSISATSSNVQLAAPSDVFPALTIKNVGASEIFCALGVNNTVAATTTAFDVAINAGENAAIWAGNYSWVACVTASSTSTARLIQANGSTFFNGGGGGSSGPGGNVTIIGPFGQAVMASSLPVTIASNQSALPVTESGAWNITNITGTVSLPTGASTTAAQASELIQVTNLNTVAGTISDAAWSGSGTGTENQIEKDIDLQLRTMNATLLTATPACTKTSGVCPTIGEVQVVNPGTPLTPVTVTLSSTTPSQIFAAPGAGLKNYIDFVSIGNSSATVGTEVDITDGSGGTVFYQCGAGANFGGCHGPTQAGGQAQPTANTALYAADETGGVTSVKVTVFGHTAP